MTSTLKMVMWSEMLATYTRLYDITAQSELFDCCGNVITYVMLVVLFWWPAQVMN
jgi:hypothetical protein